MLSKAQALAGDRMKTLVADAAAAMNTQLAAEIERLETLRTINDHVRPEEIAALQQQKNELQSAIESARLRLDSLRLVLRLPAGK
jgi:ATP-dependent helicase HepA